jgi:uncharacterized membrane protein
VGRGAGHGDTSLITAAPVEGTGVDVLVKTLAHYIALAAEAVAVFFIVMGIVTSAYTYLKEGVVKRRTHVAMVVMRNDLGHMLSLSLEFLIGADVLRTAISPTWEEIGKLAAIVGIRTLLNFFLIKELRELGGAELRAAEDRDGGGAPE